MSASLDRARDFMLGNARTLDRRRFEYHFEDGPADAVVAALGAYRNPDGGFGHALEADLRTSESQPIFCEIGLAVLAELDAVGHPWISGTCDFLDRVAEANGRVHPILASALEAPRADHWELQSWAPNTPNPTAGLAGVLHALGAEHRWLDRASSWLWGRIAQGPIEDIHELVGVATFLSQVPDRSRAEAALDSVMAQLPGAAYFLADPSDGYGVTPLQFAPSPEAPLARYFDAAQIEAHLDAVEARQQEDGGWPISFTPPSEAAVWEWRGSWTLDALRILRAWDRV
jgi:hypothetical protein